MNRIPKAVYTKEFREEAVKLAMTEGVGVSEGKEFLRNSRRTLRGSRGEVQCDRTDATGISGAADVSAAGCFRERLLRVAQALAVFAGTAGAETGGRSARGASAYT